MGAEWRSLTVVTPWTKDSRHAGGFAAAGRCSGTVIYEVHILNRDVDHRDAVAFTSQEGHGSGTFGANYPAAMSPDSI